MDACQAGEGMAIVIVGTRIYQYDKLLSGLLRDCAFIWISERAADLDGSVRHHLLMGVCRG